MPWQRQAADVIGEVLPDGRMAYPLVVIIAPRRAGKTGLTLPTSLQRGAIAQRQLVLYTAQTRQDAVDKFRDDWVPIIGSSRYERACRVRLSNGSEGLYLANRSSVRLFAPGPKGAHGKDVDRATVDEAWAFDRIAGADIEAGVRPAMLTRTRRQFEVISAGGTADSSWLLDYRDLGRAAVDRQLAGYESHVCYIEYSADEDRDDLDDPATVLRTHPAVGHTAQAAAIEQDRESMTAGLWQRSYLCIFTGSSETREVPRKAWEHATDPDHDPGDPRFFTFDIRPDRSAAAISTAGRVGDRTAVRVVDHRAGVDWLDDRLIELQDRWRAELVTDGTGPAIPVVDRLTRAGRHVHTLTSREYAAASGSLLDALLAESPTLTHADQPILTDQAAIIAKRQTLDGFVWSRTRSNGDVTAFISAMIAHYWANRVPTTPARVRFG